MKEEKKPGVSNYLVALFILLYAVLAALATINELLYLVCGMLIAMIAREIKNRQ